MITRDLRRVIVRAVAAAGFGPEEDPRLRPAGTPGRYAASVALSLSDNPSETAEILAGTLAQEHWIKTAEVTGPGYLTITVTPEALAAVADAVINAGQACVTSDALAGQAVPAAPAGDPLAAPTWEKARAALAARLTSRLAAAAGATVAEVPGTERFRVSRQASTDERTQASRTRSEVPAAPDWTASSARCTDFGRDEAGHAGHASGGNSLYLGLQRSASPATEPRAAGRDETEVARAVAFAGGDAVTFTLARAIPGKLLRVEPEVIARHVLGNPAYAVRYAHARAASGVRWAATSSAADTIGVAEAAALLDALSWLPERVATAARRGRPDEFARYLEDLASVTVDILSSASHPGSAGPDWGAAPGSARLTLARAARTGLAAGLGLLGVSAPERL